MRHSFFERCPGRPGAAHKVLLERGYKRHGEQPVLGELKCCESAPDPFDFILCNQVLEHIQKPVPIGHKLVSLLRPGGILLIDVPNANCLGERRDRGSTLDPTAHCNHFTLKTLSQYVGGLGCDVIYRSASPSLISLYRRVGLSRLANPVAALTKALLPPIGSGDCVIGRKTDRGDC